ncbi:hypothetical protein GCM10010251_53980 [Streptomyces aurantiogriseus]|uniref:Uncharacterized protein n=1 Tax=Streptomyces aurantiogriseus TaxID=66870 RepID=A0A918CMN4_9ACTN|nr:hypothetical protein GCM10010251_53980 [Streptomyces aurantiogriseus]
MADVRGYGTNDGVHGGMRDCRDERAEGRDGRRSTGSFGRGVDALDRAHPSAWTSACTGSADRGCDGGRVGGEPGASIGRLTARQMWPTTSGADMTGFHGAAYAYRIFPSKETG